MSKFRVQKELQAPRERVFEMCSDFPNAADRIDAIESIEMLTDGPVGVGTRFKETRTMFGRQATEEMEVTDYTPPSRVTVASESCGARFEITFRFTEQSKNSTRVDVEMDVTPLTIMAKLMSPLGKLMSGSMRKCLEQDLASIERACRQTTQEEPAPNKPERSAGEPTPTESPQSVSDSN